MFRAYFDDSGTHTGGTTGPSPIVVVAGFVAKDEQWDRFNENWAEILRRNDLSHFRMADFEARRGDYAGMSDPQRSVLLDQLFRVISVRISVAIASGVLTSDYEEELTGLEKRRYGKPFCFAAQMAWMGIRVWADQCNHHEPIPFVFEDGTLHKGQVMRAFENSTKRPNLTRLYRLPSLSWGDKVSFPPLQAADIFAYTVYRVMNATLGGNSPSKWARMVAEGIPYIGRGTADREVLRSMVNDLNRDFEAALIADAERDA